MGVNGRVDSCAQIVKYGMFAANILIFIGGVIVFIYGVITLTDRNFISELTGSNLFTGALFAIVISSALVSLLTFLGWFGAIKEIKCMLLMYSILMFLIFVTMLLGGILAFVFREKVEITMKQEMFSSTKLYGVRRQVTNSWDLTQSRLKCCGVDTFRDWYGKVPKTCCLDHDSLQYTPCQDNPNAANVHLRGCYEVGSHFIRERAAIVSVLGIIQALIMILGIVFSCLFFNMIE